MNNYLEQAKETLRLEAEAITDLLPRIDEHFQAAVEMICACQGRVIITGMGKSGHIGNKLAATMASTGTPSFFLHPAEGVHGDLGMVTAEDVVIALSDAAKKAEEDAKEREKELRRLERQGDSIGMSRMRIK